LPPFDYQKSKTMKKQFLLLVLVMFSLLAHAQYAEPAVTGANFVPNSVGVGSEAILKVSFANTGSTPIPVNSIELTVTTASTYYKTDGTSQPTGTGAALFTWTYLGSDMWRGSNKSVVAAYDGGDILFKVKGILVSPTFETTNINVQPTANFTAFADAPANNNLQPKLKVIDALVGSTDLKITKTIKELNKIKSLGEVVTYKVVVKNTGTVAATNVVVKDSVSAGLSLQSGVANKGSFSSPLWTIPSLAAGDSALLTVTAKVIAEGISFNYAIIKQADQTDPVPSNNTDNVCLTVPIQLCALQKVEASVPANYTNVVWFKAGQQVATGSVVLLSEIGVYTYTASNSTCPASGCCPIIIEAGTNCCPVQMCIPVTVVKKKK
jgi:uncharacterized repeat protein (TIGR01451 family)